jgi:hypothetical protein
VTDTLTAVDDQCITAVTGAVTLSGTPAEGDKIWLEFYRDADAAGDTLGATAILTDIEMFITTNAGNDA